MALSNKKLPPSKPLCRTDRPSTSIRSGTTSSSFNSQRRSVTRRLLAVPQEEYNLHPYSFRLQGAARGPTEAFQDCLQPDSSTMAQRSKDNSGGASSSDADTISDYPIRMKDDSGIKAPIDRSIPFDDPGLCHVRDIFFCYAFIARFFGIIRKACVGMPLEMYRFEALQTALLSRRRMRMLDSINCAVINIIVADDPKSDNVNFSSYTKYLMQMQLDLRSADWNTLDYENPFQQTDNYYDIPPLMRVKLLTTLVEQALERSSYIKEQIETWYTENEWGSIREESFGYDRYGRSYWIFDKRSMLIFRETKYTDAWECITRSLKDVKRLVLYFTQTNDSLEKALRQRLIEDIVRPEKENIIKARKAKAYKMKLAQTREEENADRIEARNTYNKIDQKVLPDRQVGTVETQDDDNLSDILNSDYDDPDIEEDICRFVARKASGPSLDRSTALSSHPIVAAKIRQYDEFVDNDKNIMDAFGNRYRPEYLNDCFDGWVAAVVIPTTSVPFHGNTLSPTIESTKSHPHSQLTPYMSTLPTTKGTTGEDVTREQWCRTCDFLDFK